MDTLKQPLRPSNHKDDQDDLIKHYWSTIRKLGGQYGKQSYVSNSGPPAHVIVEPRKRDIHSGISK